MSVEKINLRNGLLILMIVAAAACRFLNLANLPVLSNFTPVGAIALFGGAYFSDRIKAYLVPLLTLFLSDLVINYFYTQKLTFFYEGVIWVYLSFAIMVFIGTRIRRVNVTNVLFASLASVLVHWLLTDIEPWLSSTIYPKNISGYVQALIAAIPFERNMLLGNLLYGALLFGGFELAKRRYPALKPQQELAL
ncbi:MAG: hypothetical protein INR69_13920 [Mucilaginibacter polytrichastri]|nr:hypothetical protein [Mucilaginibacter polytrichastri]